MLDRYPPREDASAPGRPPPRPPATTVTPTAGPAPAAPTDPGAMGRGTPPSGPLIRLDRPFDADEFSTLLGGTSVRVNVPRDSLPEVLRRVTDFMGFGIYVYAITIRPAPNELLKEFVVELERVDYSPEKQTWVRFVEKGPSNSPFGPSGPPE